MKHSVRQEKIRAIRIWKAKKIQEAIKAIEEECNQKIKELGYDK